MTAVLAHLRPAAGPIRRGYGLLMAIGLSAGLWAGMVKIVLTAMS